MCEIPVIAGRFCCATTLTATMVKQYAKPEIRFNKIALTMSFDFFVPALLHDDRTQSRLR